MASLYTQVEWVGSASSPTQSSIALNYFPSDKTRVEAEIAVTGMRNWGTSSILLGTNTINIASAFNLRYYPDYREVLVGTDTKSLYSGRNSVYYDSTKHMIEFGNRFITVDGVKIEDADVSFVRSSSAFYILGVPGTYNNYNSPNRLYSLKIYEGNNLVVNLIPVREKGTDKYGFYDTIMRVFYTNNLTGTLTHGEEIADIDIDVENYTNIMGLRINFDPKETMNSWIEAFSNNAVKIDFMHPAINAPYQSLHTQLANINQKWASNAIEKDRIWQLVDTRVPIEDGKSAVRNALITKLTNDYTKADLDLIFASNQDLQDLIDSICAVIMADYPDKDEVEEMIKTHGSGGGMEGYYNKTEIDSMIPEKEDLTIISNFLESRTEYYNNLKVFTRLNGKEVEN